jgi:hypothetical protein
MIIQHQYSNILKLLERYLNTQQSESESYYPAIKTVTKEGGNILENVLFQISSNDKLSVNDLHHAYLKFNVKHNFIYNIDA